MRTEINLNDWLLSLVEDRLDTLTSFGRDLERMSIEELQRFRESMDESAQRIADDGERSEFFEWHLDTLIKYQDEYPQVGRELILVKANFILEAELMELARWLERDRSIPGLAKFQKGRPKNSQIGYAADYLEANGVKLARGATWNDINAIRIMRNAIVHTDGEMESTDFEPVAASSFGNVVSLKGERLTLHSPLHQVIVKPIREFFRSIDRSLYPNQ